MTVQMSAADRERANQLGLSTLVKKKKHFPMTMFCESIDRLWRTAVAAAEEEFRPTNPPPWDFILKPLAHAIEINSALESWLHHKGFQIPDEDFWLASCQVMALVVARRYERMLVNGEWVPQ